MLSFPGFGFMSALYYESFLDAKLFMISLVYRVKFLMTFMLACTAVKNCVSVVLFQCLQLSIRLKIGLNSVTQKQQHCDLLSCTVAVKEVPVFFVLYGI